MAAEKLEARVAALETEVALLKKQRAEAEEPWWKAWIGAFRDDPHFEEATKLGQKWRNSNRPRRGRKRR
jgi:hypothetical protein